MEKSTSNRLFDKMSLQWVGLMCSKTREMTHHYRYHKNMYIYIYKYIYVIKEINLHIKKMLEIDVYEIFKLDELLVFMKTTNIYWNIFFELKSVGKNRDAHWILI